MRDFRASIHIRAAEAVFAEVPLTQSFRSAPAVLSAVDAVFAAAPARHGVVPERELLEHQPHRSGAAGLVELWPLPPKEDAQKSESWEPPLGRRYQAKPRQRLIKLLARGIRKLTSGGEMLESRGRPIRPGDVITSVVTLVDAYEKQGRLGAMMFLVDEARWTNQRGELVRIGQRTTIYH